MRSILAGDDTVGTKIPSRQAELHRRVGDRRAVVAPPRRRRRTVSGGRRVSRFAKAPRVLNEPACWSCSSFSVSANRRQTEVGPADLARSDVRRMCGAMTEYTRSMSARWDGKGSWGVAPPHSCLHGHARCRVSCPSCAIRGARCELPRCDSVGPLVVGFAILWRDERALPIRPDPGAAIAVSALVFHAQKGPPEAKNLAQSRPGPPYRFTEIVPGIYSAIGTGSMNVGSNSAVIVNRDEVAIVDSHISPRVRASDAAGTQRRLPTSRCGS